MPACVETIHQKIRETRWVLFEQSSPIPHREEMDRFIQVLSAFKKQVEASASL